MYGLNHLEWINSNFKINCEYNLQPRWPLRANKAELFLPWRVSFGWVCVCKMIRENEIYFKRPGAARTKHKRKYFNTKAWWQKGHAERESPSAFHFCFFHTWKYTTERLTEWSKSKDGMQKRNCDSLITDWQAGVVGQWMLWMICRPRSESKGDTVHLAGHLCRALTNWSIQNTFVFSLLTYNLFSPLFLPDKAMYLLVYLV